MYGLFENSYEWYEWNEFMCASEDKNKLIEYITTHLNNEYKLLEKDSSEQKAAEQKEITHYVILEIEYLED